MKNLMIIGALFLVSTLASNVADARKEDRWIRFQCQAQGMYRGDVKVVQGWQRDSMSEAATSAMNQCNMKGISGCAIKKCYKRIWN